MASKVIEISLDRLGVQENGEITRQEGRNVLSASLVYPAPGRPLLSTMKALKLGQNQPVNFTTDNDPATRQPYMWADRLLFKEEVAERTLLTLQLTDVVTAPAFEKFLAAVLGTAFKAAWAEFTGGISNVLLGAVAGAIGAQHVESLKLDGNTIYVLGEASIGIDLTQPLPRQETRDLIVPAVVSRSRDVLDMQTGKVLRTEQLHLNKGDVNGEVVISIREV